MDPNYKNLIWTKHALSRMRERGIKQSDAYAVWCNPEKTKFAKAKAAWIYVRKVNGRKIGIVAKKNEEGKWLVISVWAKDAIYVKRKAKKSITIKKIFSKLFRSLAHSR